MFRRYAVTNTRFIGLVGRALLSSHEQPGKRAQGELTDYATAVDRRDARGCDESLIDFALDSLPAMRLEDGAFCFERRVGELAPVGRSARYTLMVELGLLRAQDGRVRRPVRRRRARRGGLARARGTGAHARATSA